MCSRRVQFQYLINEVLLIASTFTHSTLCRHNKERSCNDTPQLDTVRRTLCTLYYIRSPLVLLFIFMSILKFTFLAGLLVL